jgi:tRNA(Ile)-lysidine synthase
VIHPLLFAKRREIESYARQRKLSYSEDLSNTDRQFLRNRVRWDIVNTLEDVIGPHVVSSICRCGDAAGEAERFLQSVSGKVQRKITVTKSENQIILDLYKFLSYLKAVQKAVLINCIEEMAGCRGCVRSSEIIRILKLAEGGRSGARVELRSRVRVYKSKSTLAFVKQESSIPEKMLPIGSSVRLTKDILLKSELLQREGKHIVFNNNPAIEYFDYDTLSYPLHLRSVRPGDWFIPLGMKRKKKLQDFFIDQGLPFYQRSLIPLLITSGNIAWVVGYRMDDRYKVCEQTRKILKIEVLSSRNSRTFKVSLPKI